MSWLTPARASYSRRSGTWSACRKGRNAPLDEGWEEGLEDVPAGDGRPEVDQDNLAFISYSAGTTGKPKGIANPHRAPVLSYLWRFGISDYAPGDRVGCNVFFIWEMMRPLLRGATTVVIPDDVADHPKALIRFLEEYGITETLFTPSLLEAVLSLSGPDVGERLSKLRTLWLNGEVVTRTLARRAMELLPDARLLNVYSCSETHEVAAGDLRELVENPESTYCAVGVPMDPEHLYLLDAEGEHVPEGEAGELFVGGDCLARGYVELPEKTEESFPEDPFSSKNGAKMYRSGDRARILSDGSLEILGRVDFMVKIRGYSVELGAVEAAIEKGLAVKSCVVVSEGEEGEDKRLVAYIVPDPEDDERYSGWSLDPKTGRSKEIRSILQDGLPHYAVPSVFVELSRSRYRLLRARSTARNFRPRHPAQHGRDTGDAARLPETASRSEKEALLVRAWEDVLRLDEGEVGLEDDFFDLGGHSLAAAQLSSRVEQGFGVHVSMPLFMEDPTPGGLLDRIEALQRDGSVGEVTTAENLTADADLDPEITPQPAAKRADPAGRRRSLPHRNDRVPRRLPARRAARRDRSTRPLPRQAARGRDPISIGPMSQPRSVTQKSRSDSPRSKRYAKSCAFLIEKPPWVSTVPLGRPVVPEV